MKSLLLLLFVIPLAILAAFEELSPLAGLANSSENSPARIMPTEITYFVQLIRGNDRDEPPISGTHLVGPRLKNTMRAAFRLKSFWEIKREKVKITPGHRASVTLADGREVLIDLTEPGKRKVAAFRDGELMGRAIRRVGPAMTIIGGNNPPENVWFVVVRRDDPSLQ